MGAWDFSVFDDDSACDALEELKEAEDIISLMEDYFERASEGDYLEYDNGCCILAAAAVMDSVLNGTVYSCYDEEYEDWIQSLKQEPYGKWLEEKTAICKRLQ